MSRYKYCPQCAKPLELALHGEMQRIACPDRSCGFVLWDNPVPVVAAIVEHEGEIILARNAAWPPKMFALITGFLEKNDPHPESGVLREVEEELGLKGRIGEFIGFYPFERMNQIIIAYHVIAEGTVNLGEELIEWKKLPLDKIKPWPAGTGYAVRDLQIRRGFTPPPFDLNMLRKPRHWREISERLLTAGQPSAEEFQSLKVIGVDVVINLSMPDSDHALPDEDQIAARHGMRYHHIPVLFDAPTADDFQRFCAAMAASRDSTVFVHCAANKRVSAFVFLWRVLTQGVPRDVAERDLLAVWTPDAVWSAFIAAQLQ
jgi:NAD+ diphosphatase